MLNPGQPIVTIVDLSDTWVRAAIPETDADHIGLGDTLRIRLPGGTITSGKVFFKSAEADFATQRDVSRRKRDIRTIVLKVRLENPKGAYVPGMTADVLVSPATDSKAQPEPRTPQRSAAMIADLNPNGDSGACPPATDAASPATP